LISARPRQLVEMWLNSRCSTLFQVQVAFWLALANAVIVVGRLLRRAWSCYRRQGCPRRRP
jgi:hypothetical protein